jgi:hypothetical protein
MIKAWLLCPRKFGFDYIDQVPRRHTAATEFGEKTHEQLEKYLSTGKVDQTEHGRLALTGTHLLPPPNLQGMELEKFFEFDLQNVPFHGTKDVQIHASNYIAVFDHKTTAAWRWIMSEEDLRHDPQVLIYAMDSVLKTGIQACWICWTYFKKRGKYEARQIAFTMTADEILNSIQPHIKTAHEIIKLSMGAKEANDLPYNANSCSAYGGCQYSEICNLSQEQVIGSIFK